MPAKKDWDRIARELSSGEDSDAGDELNVMSVQRNAQKVCDLVRTVMPGMGGNTTVRGMNRPDALRTGMADAIATASRAVTGGAPGPGAPESVPRASETTETTETEAKNAKTSVTSVASGVLESAATEDATAADS